MSRPSSADRSLPPNPDPEAFAKRYELHELLGEGGMARVDAATLRKVRNVGDVDAVYLCAGGKDGYVGRDGRLPEGEEERVRALHGLRDGQSQ